MDSRSSMIFSISDANFISRGINGRDNIQKEGSHANLDVSLIVDLRLPVDFLRYDANSTSRYADAYAAPKLYGVQQTHLFERVEDMLPITRGTNARNTGVACYEK